MAKLVRLSTIVSNMPSIWSLGLICRFTLFTGLEQLFQALGGQVLRLNGDYDPVAAARALTVSIPRDGWQSIRIWEYCPLSVSRYCRRMVSRLMAFTRRPPCRRAGCLRASGQRPPGGAGYPRRGAAARPSGIRPIASDRVKGSLSGWGWPRLMVRLPCGSPSISSTFFPACASPIPQVRAGWLSCQRRLSGWRWR